MSRHRQPRNIGIVPPLAFGSLRPFEESETGDENSSDGGSAGPLYSGRSNSSFTGGAVVECGVLVGATAARQISARNQAAQGANQSGSETQVVSKPVVRASNRDGRRVRNLVAHCDDDFE